MKIYNKPEKTTANAKSCPIITKLIMEKTAKHKLLFIVRS